MNPAEEEIYNCLECGSRMTFRSFDHIGEIRFATYECPNVACQSRLHNVEN